MKADFDLSRRELLLASGFVGETSSESHLVQLLTHEAEPHMPLMSERLSDTAIASIRKWIDLGAPYDKPLTDGPADKSGKPMVVTNSDREFWSFRPLQPVKIPDVDHVEWCRTDVDRFILERQEQADLLPNNTADRRTLIRRATFDLLGLPATPEEVEAFVNDPAADAVAWERVVNRLLESPHYGERWARHWMDVARFAESHGYEQDYDRPSAYHYRDFLIRAFNDDLPFDQFVQWQLAGDELAPNNPLALMATGFLGAGAFPTQLTEAEFESARYDELDDMVTTTGVAFLGLSLGCARCHDHKFDPVPAHDYYRMAATFTTAIRSEVELDLQPNINQQRLAEWNQQHKALQDQLQNFEQQQLSGRFRDWLKTDGFSLSMPAWVPVNIVSITSSAGTKFERQSDDSWLATGAVPRVEELTIVATSQLPTVSRLRLEALVHQSLPNNGPGRAPNGNFALTHIDVRTHASEDNDENFNSIGVNSAAATHQQNTSSLSVNSSIDSDPNTGWAVDAGGIGRDQAAVFGFTSPVSNRSGQQWTVRLTFHHPNPKHSVGRFRLSFSNDDKAPVAAGGDGPTADIQSAILEARKSLDPTSEAWSKASKWFATTLPEWKQLHEAMTKHQTAGPPQQLTKVLVTSEGLPHLPHHADGRGFPHFYPQTHFLTRGDIHQKGEVVQAGFLQVLTPPEIDESQWNVAPQNADARTSFRRATLARWITDTDHGAGSLVARVIVNRLWQHHFGRGIVATPNDFGVSGDRPSHPELIEWLAQELVNNQWHLKPLHKMIMTSSVYLQSAEHDESRAMTDRENRFLWRWAPRRLEAEAIRDSMLAVSGRLNRTMYGPGTLDQNMDRRSVY
ncbi:MAG: DUF1549 domain-containing protein, partial [Planctomycetaceae bacterium]|nr:DUF1549 domain-containing protein [Planctomycetaceae bacterium]